MDSPTVVGPVLDEDKYRQEVLQMASAEVEQARAQRLSDEARQLGLKLPEIEAAAPLAATIASGMVDLSSPVLSSGSSTDRNSVGDGSVTPSLEPSSPSPSPLDPVVSSFSDITLASERAKPGSTRSLASLSTRPTSYCSTDSRTVASPYGLNPEGLTVKGNRNSLLSVASADKQEKRRSGFKSAIGRIHFRKRRPPSVLLLPPDAMVTVSKGDGGIEHVYLETKPEPPTSAITSSRPSSAVTSAPKLEIPIFDKEALQRSLDDPELSMMLEQHSLERDRHMAFQDASLSILRRRHQTAISEKQSGNQRLEEEKSEKNTAAAIRLEERQLAIEMEQQREFERAKMNSRTRIKHMEGYFRNASPPPSPGTTTQRRSESFSGSDSAAPARRFTQQQKEQLEQQYHHHESMDALHEARIKVLRDRQEVKLQETIARMENELEKLCDKHAKDVTSLQAEHRREETSIIQALDNKKNELRHRWHLEEAILRRQLEVRNGLQYGPLPPISFSTVDSDTQDSAICVPESAAVSAESQ
ncbi:uncharacterized protein N7459_000562 [Penicillium hispanicum]|uniref:uncharacterized protein n=1 Tax=Penicillium hispanicum TaxID=1080232 RepID=UPI00253FC1C8|nr:uncharacterized protein N7459_000562 [Penicillium hispanicum]KAJ5594354.1 hypothetical protein N7459_000562 [Penicillium hispanicum]